jgi:SAM-dependent methyltransferase
MPESAIPSDNDSSRTQFWVRRWERDKHPWDLGKVPPDLLRFLGEDHPQPARVLIPGCGSGYEVRAFDDAGHDVLAVDFSGPAVTHAKEIMGPLGDRVVQMNFFKHDFGDDRFGLVYERGFLCSLPQERWQEYAAKMAHLIKPGGRLMGLFLYGLEPEPPPFPLNDETAAALLGPYFELKQSRPAAPDTVPVYQGMERWQEWVRRSPG